MVFFIVLFVNKINVLLSSIHVPLLIDVILHQYNVSVHKCPACLVLFNIHLWRNRYWSNILSILPLFISIYAHDISKISLLISRGEYQNFALLDKASLTIIFYSSCYYHYYYQRQLCVYFHVVTKTINTADILAPLQLTND